MNELQPYQTRLDRASQIKVGDFLDLIEPNTTLRGTRGGKYTFAGVLVESRVVSAEQTPRGFSIKTRSGGSFTLPGNLANLTGAIVRRDP
jgi:hypothetical protein